MDNILALSFQILSSIIGAIVGFLLSRKFDSIDTTQVIHVENTTTVNDFSTPITFTSQSKDSHTSDYSPWIRILFATISGIVAISLFMTYRFYIEIFVPLIVSIETILLVMLYERLKRKGLTTSRTVLYFLKYPFWIILFVILLSGNIFAPDTFSQYLGLFAHGDFSGNLLQVTRSFGNPAMIYFLAKALGYVFVIAISSFEFFHLIKRKNSYLASLGARYYISIIAIILITCGPFAALVNYCRSFQTLPF